MQESRLSVEWSVLMLRGVFVISCVFVFVMAPFVLLAGDSDNERQPHASVQSGLASEDMIALFYTFWTQYSESLTSSKAEKVADFYTEDAILMEPERHDIMGRDAIQSYFAEMFDRVEIKKSSIIPGETRIYGDTLFQFGTFHESRQPKDKRVSGVDGRFFSIWQRQPDGSWKIARLMHSPTQ